MCKGFEGVPLCQLWNNAWCSHRRNRSSGIRGWPICNSCCKISFPDRPFDIESLEARCNNLRESALRLYAPYIQYRCTIIRKHQRLSKAIADWNEIAVVYRIRCVVGTQRVWLDIATSMYTRVIYTRAHHTRTSMYTRVHLCIHACSIPTLLLRYLDRPETITLPLCSSPPYLLLKSNLFVYLFYLYRRDFRFSSLDGRERIPRSFVRRYTLRVKRVNKRANDLPTYGEVETTRMWKINVPTIRINILSKFFSILTRNNYRNESGKQTRKENRLEPKIWRGFDELSTRFTDIELGMELYIVTRYSREACRYIGFSALYVIVKQ